MPFLRNKTFHIAKYPRAEPACVAPSGPAQTSFLRERRTPTGPWMLMRNKTFRIVKTTRFEFTNSGKAARHGPRFSANAGRRQGPGMLSGK